MPYKKLALALLCLTSFSATYADIYKTVDAQGHTTFTNKPPASLSNTAVAPKNAEKIQLKEGYSNTLNVTQIGSTYYCGSIALPTRSPSNTIFYTTVASNQRIWRTEIDRIEKTQSQYNRYGSSQYNQYNRSPSAQNSPELLAKLAEYQCAFEWAQQQRKTAATEKATLVNRSLGLNSYIQELSTAQKNVCSEEPIFSSQDRYYEDKHRTWQTCASNYTSKMSTADSDLKKLDQQLLDIHRIEETN